jgi:hypothetical protein
VLSQLDERRQDVRLGQQRVHIEDVRQVDRYVRRPVRAKLRRRRRVHERQLRPGDGRVRARACLGGDRGGMHGQRLVHDGRVRRRHPGGVRTLPGGTATTATRAQTTRATRRRGPARTSRPRPRLRPAARTTTRARSTPAIARRASARTLRGATATTATHARTTRAEVRVKCLQKTPPPVLIFCENKNDVDDIFEYILSRASTPLPSSPRRSTATVKSLAPSQQLLRSLTSPGGRGTVYRIGRTGRCGRTGVATTFINKSVPETVLLDLKHLLIEAKQRVPNILLALRGPEDEADANDDGEPPCAPSPLWRLGRCVLGFPVKITTSTSLPLSCL